MQTEEGKGDPLAYLGGEILAAILIKITLLAKNSTE
jgi:hypothetical protein